MKINRMKLETARLILREWEHRDLDDLIDGLNNLEVTKWLAFVPYPYTRNDAENWINCCSEIKAKNKDSYEFAIELKSEGKVIGGTSLNIIDKFQKIGGGGIWINAKYQNHGYGIEAFRERLRFAFEELSLRRIENGFFKGNFSSFKMLDKLGYQLEGMRRKRLICMANGEIKDEYICGLLSEEWRKTQL